MLHLINTSQVGGKLRARALHHAADAAADGCTQLLLARKADPEARNARGETALQVARKRAQIFKDGPSKESYEAALRCASYLQEVRRSEGLHTRHTSHASVILHPPSYTHPSHRRLSHPPTPHPLPLTHLPLTHLPLTPCPSLPAPHPPAPHSLPHSLPLTPCPSPSTGGGEVEAREARRPRHPAAALPSQEGQGHGHREAKAGQSCGGRPRRTGGGGESGGEGGAEGGSGGAGGGVDRPRRAAVRRGF